MTRTPPAGVALQLARSFDFDTDELTPTPETVPEAIAQVGRRQKQTQQTSQSALDHIGQLRYELGGRIDRVEGRLDGLTSQSANVEGKMDILTDVVQRSLDEQSRIHVSRVTASIEVEKSAATAGIETQKERAAFPRQLVLKVIAVAGPLLAAALTAGALKC